jgi:serine/threonine-protein kinase
MVGQLLAHYIIREKIGAGGMGVVYRAHDERLSRDVAIKVLPSELLSDDTARKRFRKEALALAKLNHPNIETVHEFGNDEGLDFLVTEYIPGISLDAKLAAGALPERQVLLFGIQLAEGLQAAHREGVVHRDLKPDNLRVQPDGHLKILDFGLATLLPRVEPSQETVSLPETGLGGGTLPYMSPEQLRGEAVDGRTDIWAAGVVLYEMATGRRPFDRKLATALTAEIIDQPPPPLAGLKPGLSPRLEDVILKCLEKDPDNRYQSAKELAVDLRRLATPSLVATEPRQTHRSFRVRFAVATLTPLSILALLFIVNAGGWRERLMHRPSALPIQSLAVLPLENLSSDPAQEYFVDGMTDELIADLSKIGALRVISRTSVMQYKATRKPLSQIAKELRVDALIEGSVLRAGDHVRITTRLTQVAADKQLWAESYEGDLRDVLKLQNDVARAIASEVRSKLTPNEQSRLSNSRQIDPRAYEAYLKGRYNWNQRNAAVLRTALESFQHAIDIDPTYAAAYAGLADTYNLMGSNELLPARDALERARAAAQKALELDDNLAEAHASLAGVLQSGNDWNFKAAEVEFKQAIELNPNYATAHFWYGLNLLPLKRPDEALREFRRAEELDPLSPVVSTYVGFAMEKARRYDEAIAANLETTALFPDFAFGHWALAMAYRQKGMYQQAISEFKKAIELSEGRPDFMATLGHAYAVSGDKSQALKIAHQLEASHAPPFVMALVYLGLGDKDRTFSLLEQAYEQRFPSILPEALQDPLFDPVRADRRFQELLRLLGLPG